jgi:hypothetical protein
MMDLQPASTTPEPADSRTEGYLDDVQVAVLGDDALSAAGAMVIGSLDSDGTKHRHHLLASILDKLGAVPLRAIDPASPVSPAVGVQQLLQNVASGPVHRCPESFLARFQIHMPQLLPVPEHPHYSTPDFFFDLLPNCLDNVFFNVSNSA